MTNTVLKKGDVVTVGRKKDKYRVVHATPNGTGAVLVETIGDKVGYATTYINAADLNIVKARASQGDGQSAPADGETPTDQSGTEVPAAE